MRWIWVGPGVIVAGGSVSWIESVVGGIIVLAGVVLMASAVWYEMLKS